MTEIKQENRVHPTEVELADFLSKKLSVKEKAKVEDHIACCAECLEKTVSAYESVKIFKKGEANFMKKMNVYLVSTIIMFILSFIVPRFFLQFLAATLLLGIKWVVDSKSTKMLVMIYDAWKRGGAEETSRILSSIEKDPKNRL